MFRIFLFYFLFCAACSHSSLYRKQLGGSGNWKNTTLAVGVENNMLYSIESNGGLYKTDLAKGKRKRVMVKERRKDKPKLVFFKDFEKPKALYTWENKLYYLAEDGEMKVIDLASRERSPLGKKEDFSKVQVGAFLAGKFYAIRKSNTLWVTDLAKGETSKVSGPNFYEATALFAQRDKLYLIEKGGNLSRVNPETGDRVPLGNPGDFGDVLGRAQNGDKLYFIKRGGALYQGDLSTGSWQRLSDYNFYDAKGLYFSKDKLVYINQRGNLYDITPLPTK